MKSLLRRFLGKIHGPESDKHDADQADEQRNVELEALEPRMLFSAAPVEAPDDAETPDPEAEAARAQAADESVIEESGTASGSTGSSTQVAAPVSSGSFVVTQAAAQQAAVSLEGTELEGEDELGTVGAAHSIEQAEADTAATEISGVQNVTLVNVDGVSAGLNQATLDAVAEAARQRWIDSGGLSGDQVAALDNITYQIAHLDAVRLGSVDGNTISVDGDAWGQGWFIDSTPLDDSEFGSTLASGALAAGDGLGGRVDLLTVLLHEQGHILGLDDTVAAGTATGDVTSSSISAGIRLLPTAEQAAGLTPGAVDGPSFVSMTFGVTNLLDDGSVGSLRWAIGQANANPDPDFIEFTGGGVGQIDLLTQLTITDDVTINSNNAVGVIVNQTGTNQRVFEVQGGAGTAAEVTIFQDMTISGGDRTNSVGGGVYINGWADVTFDNVGITNNSATEGGGFYVAGSLGAKVTLTNSDIVNNTAIVRGGGFRNSGFDTVVTMSDGKIDNNTVNNEHGGGFYNNGKVVLTNVDITYNSVNDLDNTNSRFDDSYGGGFFNNASGLHPNAGQVEITGGSITGNKAFGHGGGFWNRGGTVTIDGTSGDPVEIYRNQAGAAGTNGDTDGKGGDNRSGGGFWATDAATTKLNWVNFGNGTDSNDSNKVTSINQSDANNDLRGVGAGFFNSSNSQTWLTNVDLSHQRADQGAAFYQDGIDSKIIGLNVEMNDGFARTRGGGFRNATTGALVDLTDSSIDGNTAQEEHGGGIYNNGTLNLDNTDVSNSIALDLSTTFRRDSHGGGIYNGGGTINMTNGSDVLDNVTYGMGGGVWNTGGEFNMTDGKIDGNSLVMFSTSTRHGGGIWNQADSVANFHNVTISNNETGRDVPTGPSKLDPSESAGTRSRGVGGGIWNTDGSIVNITGDSQLIGNRSEDGGAIYNTSTKSTINITGTAANPIEIGTMADPNSARVRGGGFRSTGNSIMNLEYVDIQYNTTDDERGGGFYADGAQITGNNVRIHDNHSGTITDNGNEQGGGFWVNSSGKTVLTDSQIINNRSESNGGGFYVENGNVELTNTIVEGNFAENSGGGFFIDNSGNVDLTDVSVTDNIARDHGGGFWSEDDSKANILRTNIDDNLAGYEDDGTTRVTGRYGGGFWSRGRSQVTLTDSTVDRNEASVSAGGIFLDDDAHLIANGSSISENLASGEHGGGFRLDDRSTADITNSTISGNYAGFSAADNGGTPVLKVNDRVGGGLWTVHSTATANLNHVTVAENKASSGGGAGLYRSSGQINIENTIVYDNIGDFDNTMNASDTAGNSGLSVNLTEANVIGTNTSGTLQGNTLGLITTDPVLGPLMDNGGPTLPDTNSPRTHMIGSGGSADETATGSTVAVDQRGEGRSSDIGAYELDPVATTLTIDDLIVPANAISGTAFDVEVVSTVVGGTVASVAWSVDAPVGGNLDTGTGETASLNASNPSTDPVQTVDVTVTVTSTTGQTASETTQVRLVDTMAMPMTGTGSAIVTIATDEDDGDVSLGDISLREAIKLANASAAGTFVITFDSALNGTDIEMSIAPTSGTDNENGNLRGDFDITKSNGVVSIVGNGAANTTINAMQVDRVFHLHSGRIAYFTGLTITGGETTTTDRQGAGLYNDGGTAVFKNVDIDGNAAAQATDAAVGGGMYLRANGSNASQTYMTGGSVANNTAESNGGGIYFEGTNVGESILWMDGTALSNNTASFSTNLDLDSRRGGGIYMTDDGNRLVLNDVTVEDNKTLGRNASDGGGLAIAGADHTIDITGGSIIRNQAGDNLGGIGTSDSDGGGLWSGAFRSEFNFTGVDIGGELAGGTDADGIGTARVNGNIAEDEGGGFYLEGRFNTYNLVDTRIIGNQANDDGGGFMVINDTETVNISQTGADLGVIRNNFSETSNGGGFRSDGILNITGTATIPFEIRYNEARGSVGGGFYTNQNSTATLTDVVIRNNEARNNGGGYYNAGGAHVIITSSTPSTSGTPGSFVSKIIDNEARFGDGGGFYSTTMLSKNDLNDVLISGNIAADEAAGFYLSSNFAEVNLTDVDLVDNTSQDSGGGFYNASNSSVVNLDNVLIDGNNAVTEHGGGFRNNGHVNGKNVTITNNEAGAGDGGNDRVGGGFYNPSGRVDLTDVIIEDNTANARGGGFYSSGGGIVDIDSSDPNTFRSSISNNTVLTASNDGGGFYQESAGTLTILTSVDVNNNTAGDQGGGFFQRSDMARVDLVDVTINNNTAGGHAGGFRNESAWSIVTLDNTRITNNTTTEHHGGGFWNRGSITGQDVIIDGNVASTAQAAADSNDNNIGGGFWNNGDGAYMDLTRVEITNNDSHGRGGGVYNDSRAELRLTDFIISGNSTDQDTSESQGRGGGIWNSSGADVFMNRGEISANTSFGHGGGVYSQESGATISATNVTFSGNTAGIDPGEGFEGSMVGGGLWAQSNGGTVYLDHTTFTDNKATRPNADAGAGFRVDSNGLNVTMKDSVAYGNSRNAAGALVDDDLDQNLTGSNFILEGNNIVGFRSGNLPTGGTGSVTEGISPANDPGFLPLLDLGGAVLPSGGSPRVHAITVGANASDTAVTSTLTEDQRGITRPEGPFNDIGAYEGPSTIYVNDEWAGSTLGDEFDGDLELAGAQQSFFGVSAFESIDAALTTYAGFGGSMVVNGGDYSGTTATLTGGLMGDITLQLVQDLTNSETTVIFDSLSGDSLDAIDTSLHGSAVRLVVGDASSSTTFGGVISGSGSLMKIGSGSTLTLTNTNNYTGGTAIGSLNIVSGLPTDEGGTLEIQDSSALGTGTLTFQQGGTLEFGVSGLGVANDIFVPNWGGGVRTIRLDEAGTATGELSGDMDMRFSAANGFVADAGASDTLTFSGTISTGAGGGAGITKQGDGTLVLSGNNSYRGQTTISDGILEISSGTALGSTLEDTTIDQNNQAVLRLTGGISVAEDLELTGSQNQAAIDNIGGANTISGLLSVTGASSRIRSSGGSLTYTGGVTGTGNTFFVVNSTGGSTEFTTNPIDINNGTFWADSGGLTIVGVSGNSWASTTLTSGTLRTDVDNALPATTTFRHSGLSYGSGATLDLNGTQQTVASLFTGTTLANAGGSDITSSTAATLTVNQSSNTEYNGGTSGAVSLVKSGSGTLTLNESATGVSLAHTGTTAVNDGTLTLNGSHTGAGAYSVASPGILNGSGGTDGSVTSTGGTVDPGVGTTPGTLGAGDTSLDASSNFNIRVDGNTAGDGAGNHDQLTVTGTVAVGGALNLSGTHVPVIGESFVIISNDGTDFTTGAFTGLAEGAPVTFGGSTLYITYNGNDGNDVVLNTIPEINDTGANDILTIDMLAGGDLQYTLNSNPLVTLTAPASFTFNGGDGDDLMIVNTNDLSLPAGGIEFNGGPQTYPGAGHDPPTPNNGDALQVNGLNNTQNVLYTPDAGITGDGTVSITGGGTGTITFTGLEPVDISGMATATLTLPGADDVIDLANGFDVATGLVPAIVATGSSGGVAIESAHFFNNTTVEIDTTGTAGNDTITVTSASNAHANDNLIIDTGVEAADTVTVNGAATFGDDITITTITTAINAAVTSTNNGTIAIETDNIAIAAAVNAGTGRVEIDPLTAGTAIHFGNTTLAGELNLTDAEVDFVTADVLQIGDTTAGRIQFSGTTNGGLITPAGTNTLHLITGSFVSDGANNNTGGGIRVANLAIEAGGANAGDDRAIRINNTNGGVESRIDTFAATSSDGWIELREDDNTDVASPTVGLTIGTVDGVVGVTNTSNTGDNNRERISITAARGDLVIANDMSSRRDMFVRAAGNNNQLILNSGVTVGHVEGGTLTLRGDNIDLEGTVNSPGRTVSLQQDDNGNAMQVGTGAVDVLNDDITEISQLELDRITAGTVIIGRTDFSVPIDATGDITVVGTTTLANSNNLGFRSHGTITQNAGATITENNVGIISRGDVTLDEANVINGNVAIDLRVLNATTSGNITFRNEPSDDGWVMNGAAGVDNVFRTNNGDILVNSTKSINVDDDSDGGTGAGQGPGVQDPTVELSATTMGIGNGDITINVGDGTTDGRDFTTNDATDGNLDQVDIITDGDLNISVLGTSSGTNASTIFFGDSTNIDVGGEINLLVDGAGNNNARIEFEGGTTVDAGGDINLTVEANNGNFQTDFNDGNPVTITSTAGTLTIDADRWLVNSNTIINIAGQDMFVSPFAVGDNVLLGVGGDGTDGNLRINNDELNTVTGAGGALTIGDADTGDITVGGTIDLPVDAIFANEGSAINIDNTIDNGPAGAPVAGSSSLELNNTTGTSTVNADIGSSDALESLTTDATGTTVLATGIGITTTGNVTLNDTVQPGVGGLGQATITATGVGNGLVFNTTTIFDVELQNTTPGTGHDQLVVNGTVTLNNADLDLNPLAGLAPSAGDEFVLISNDGTDAVNGTFFGLAEGNIISLNLGGVASALFQISYQGGTLNNDVVLTALGVSATTDILIDPSGNLVINDIDETVPGGGGTGNSTDEWNISVDGTEVVVQSNGALGTLINGASQQSLNEVRVDASLFNGDVIVNGLTGDDFITIGDLGASVLPGGIMVNGGVGFDNILYTGDGSVLAAGGDAAFNAESIQFNFGDLTTTDGDIEVNGTGGVAEGGGNYQGIHLYGSDLTVGGTGSVTLNGEGGDSGNNNQGIRMTNGSSITTSDGDIDIDGSGGGAIAGQGVMINSVATLSAGGSGALTIDGTGSATGTFQNEGVFLAAGTSASVVDGPMTITGSGGGTGGGGMGVSILNALLTGTGSGDITVIGSSNGAGLNNLGVQLSATTVDTTAGSGSVTLSGSGSTHAGATSNNAGVKLSATDISTGGDGSIDIDGTGNGSGAANSGVILTAGSDLTVMGTGTISIDGTSSTAGTYTNDGVIITGGSATVADGALTITGTAAGSSGANRGLYTIGATFTGGGLGNISLTGSSTGSLAGNSGVSLNASAITTLATGSGSVTILGTGSASGTGSNEGVRLSTTPISTGADGSIDIDGSGGGNGAGIGGVGVWLGGLSTDLAVLGTGSISIDGTGGGGTSYNRGVYTSGGVDISSVNGNIGITGRGNGTATLNQGVALTGTTVDSSGSGSVTMTGTGSTVAIGIYNTGVVLLNSAATAAGGNLTLSGDGGSGSLFNEGVRIQSSTVNTTGTTSILGTANATTTSAWNSGVYIFLNTTVNGGAGSAITGVGSTGPGGFNHGVVMHLNITSNIAAGSINGTPGPSATSQDLYGNFF